MFRFLLLFAACVASSYAYRHFENKIPNGESVPHPCKANYKWLGVGHKNNKGGGERNLFGLDFFAAGNVWTKSLCRKDSDGDGRSNGQELGDPECTWTEGSIPTKLTGITHPGVCEPVDSETCRGRNDWVDCSFDEFRCEALRNDPEVRNQTVRFPQTKVPVSETTYYCMAFDFITDGDYHMIATEPIIDNAQVMHHIVLYGCNSKSHLPANKAVSCGMEFGDCNDILGLWTVGLSGECFHDEIGFRIGQSGYKYGVLQFHWNNPELRSDYVDESGMILHYTPNKRIHDAGVLIVGNRYLEIPPQRNEIKVEGTCENLKVSNGPVYVTRAANHMHYLGRQMKIEQFRNGVKLRDVTLEESYSYDSPKMFRYTKALQILPGDSLKTTCVFKSKSRTKTVFYGDGTNDEMCFGFLTYHPKENIKNPWCLSWKSLDLTSIYSSQEINGCRYWDFLLSSTDYMKSLKSRVFDNCNQMTNCLSECLSVVREVKKHPCLMGEIGDWVKTHVREGKNSKVNYQEMKDFYSSMATCDAQIEREKCDVSSNSNAVVMSYLYIVICLVLYRLTL